MIVYNFPIKEFNARDGYSLIQVRENKITLKEKPDPALRALIEKYGGELVEKKKPAKRATKKVGE